MREKGSEVAKEWLVKDIEEGLTRGGRRSSSMRERESYCKEASITLGGVEMGD